jgi:CRP-like cAMP-binding protein
VFNKKSEKTEVLKHVPLFSDLSNRHLKLIGQRFDEVAMTANTVLAQQGEMGQEFVFIAEGNVRIEKDGQRLTVLGPGDFFGEISLLDRGPRTATVIAETDVDLLVLHIQYFEVLMDEIPELARTMLRALCGYVRRAEQGQKRAATDEGS